jgi:uncharacterized protein YvpB
VRCASLALALLLVSPAWASVRLPLKYHEQEHELSCEAAALTMVLRYYGVPVVESDVIGKMPLDPTARMGDVWGDPEQGFVGNIDGEMAKTGYGIYWNAMARLASAWKKTVVLSNGSLSDLILNLDENRPVIAWGLDGPGKKLSWKTPAGREVVAFSTEHARVVYGYEGTASAPTGFFIMDPRHGPTFWSTEKFLKDWDSFGRKGIVLYP